MYLTVKRTLPAVLSIFVLVAFSASCCTQKDCSNSSKPSIYIAYVAADSSYYEKEITIRIMEKDQWREIGSYSTFLTPKWNTVEIHGGLLSSALQGYPKEIKNYHYILELPEHVDTVSDIDYEYYSYRIDCNGCFPFGDGSAKIRDYRKLEFNFQQNNYRGSDTVFVKK